MNQPAGSDWPTSVEVRFTSHRDGNLALHTNDDSAQVLRHRRRLRQSLPAEPVWLNQVHGADVISVHGAQTGVMTADASYSRLADTPLAILVADCLPVLLASTDGSEIAALHAGWRGLANGIIPATVSVFASSSIVAHLGPCIGPCHYEVDAKVYDTMSPGAKKVGFTASRAGHWDMSLQDVARHQLGACGVAVVSFDERCTACSAEAGGGDQLYSYRRATLKGDAEPRRFAALIWRSEVTPSS